MHRSAGGEEGGQKLSKKQRKLLHRLKIAELKQQCPRPDVVEVWDVTAPDPNTLVQLKVCGGEAGTALRQEQLITPIKKLCMPGCIVLTAPAPCPGAAKVISVAVTAEVPRSWLIDCAQSMLKLLRSPLVVSTSSSLLPCCSLFAIQCLSHAIGVRSESTCRASVVLRSQPSSCQTSSKRQVGDLLMLQMLLNSNAELAKRVVCGCGAQGVEWHNSSTLLRLLS